MGCEAAPSGGGADDATVRVDGRVQYQVMEGFGTTVRLFDDPHLTETFDKASMRGAVVIPAAEQEAILNRLYGDLALTRVRPATDGGIEVDNDNADPEVSDSSKFNFAWKRNDGFVDYYKRTTSRRPTQVFLSPVSLEKWQKASTPAEYTEWAMTVMRRWRALGVDLPYYSVVNEPGGEQDVSGEFIRDVIKLLGPKLRAEGFPTRMMIPDDINPTQALQRIRVVLGDPAAAPYVGAIAYHLYGSPQGRAEIKELAARYGVPVWMTEYYQADALEWANTVHELIDRDGASAVDYLWGFFGQWVDDGDQLITVTHAGDRYTGYSINKQYYTFGQFTRFVAPGSRRIAAVSREKSLRTTAYVKDGRLTIVAINNGAAALPASFALAGVPCGAQVLPVTTNATESWKQLAPLPLDGGRFSVTLAPGSVTTFTSGV